MPLAEKLAALWEILDTTTDDILKAQIQKRLDREAGTEREFMSCDSDYVHLVMLMEVEQYLQQIDAQE